MICRLLLQYFIFLLYLTCSAGSATGSRPVLCDLPVLCLHWRKTSTSTLYRYSGRPTGHDHLDVSRGLFYRPMSWHPFKMSKITGSCRLHFSDVIKLFLLYYYSLYYWRSITLWHCILNCHICNTDNKTYMILVVFFIKKYFERHTL